MIRLFFASVTGRGRAHRQQGSVLVLAVVVLVMLALLGLAFLQQAKFDRFATNRYERSYIDLVIAGVIGDMQTKLQDDVDKNRFAPEGLYDYPWTDYDGATRTDKAWREYPTPATEIDVAGDVRDDKYLASTAPHMIGTITDQDTLKLQWLHLSNLTGIWLDLPAGGGPGKPTERLINSQGTQERSDTMITGRTLSRAVDGNHLQRGYDADGDGVLDSQWAWVPSAVRDFGGRKYVMAVRMVDLGALINANVATANANNGNDATNGGQTGYTPTGLDLSRLVARTVKPNGSPLTGTEFSKQIDDLLGFRFRNITGDVPGNTTWPFNAQGRRDIWANQGSLYGYADRNYTTADELELRYHGGLNNVDYNANIEGSSTGDQGMAAALRNDPVPGTAATSALTAAQNANGGWGLEHWFNGGPSNDTVDNRQFPGIRHLLTTVSGTADYQPVYLDTSKRPTGGPDLYHKYDLNFPPLSGGLSAYEEIYDRLDLIFNYRSTSYPGYLSDLGVNVTQLKNEILPEYVANILDYADSDYTPTVAYEGSFYDGSYDTANRRHFGLESLPFLREAYFQVLYEERETTSGDGNADDASSTGGKFDTWYALDGDSTISGYSAAHENTDSRAAAIEVGNPFAHQLESGKLSGQVRLAIKMGDASATELATWVFGAGLTLPDLEARIDDTSPNPDKLADTLIIWSPPADTDAPETGSGNTGADLNTKLGFDGTDGVQTVELPAGTLQFTCNDDPIVVELQVLDPQDNTKWITYDRMETGRSFPETQNVNAGDPPHGDPTEAGYVSMAQRDASRSGNRIQYVAAVSPASVGGTLGQAAAAPVDPKDGGDSFDANAADLAKDNKTGTTDILPAYFQLPHTDGRFNSIAELGWINMIGFTEDDPFSEKLATMYQGSGPGVGPERVFLDLRPDNTSPPAPVAPPNDSGLPVAAMVFDQFSVHSPLHDNIDQDNDDGDTKLNTGKNNENESKTPGKININTATLPVLTLAAPLPETFDDTEALMRVVAGYRDAPILGDDPNTTGANQDETELRDPLNNAGMRINRTTSPGIASIGELLFMNPGNTTFNFDTGTEMEKTQTLAFDSNDLDNAYKVYPDPANADVSQPDDYQAGGGNTVSTADVPSPVEQLARWQFLSDTFTTRSDVFAAYVTIRGYTDDHFDDGPVETAQFLVIFDRTGVDTADPDKTRARVIAYRRFE